MAGARPGPGDAWLESDAPRVACPEHGVVVAAVPWARHGARFTRAFEDQVAWLAVNTSKTAVSQLMRNPRFEVVTLTSPRASGVAIVRKRRNGEPTLIFEERFRDIRAVERDSGVPLLWQENGATESEANQSSQLSGNGS